jgi:mRNA interferase MazF
VNFDPSVGAEQTKLRPAVVVNVPEVGRLPLRIVVPLTDWKPRYVEHVWFVYVPHTVENGLIKDSGADAFQVKSLSVNRFEAKIGALTAEQMDDIAAAIALCIGY